MIRAFDQFEGAVLITVQGVAGIGGFISSGRVIQERIVICRAEIHE
jgi:hypothetical protein